jgi:hypothetical protein
MRHLCRSMIIRSKLFDIPYARAVGCPDNVVVVRGYGDYGEPIPVCRMWSSVWPYHTLRIVRHGCRVY